MTNQNKPYLIGLHGKPRVGKDTTANHLIKKLNLLRYGPSVPVKDTTAAMFDIPRHYLDDDNMKDEMDPYWKMTYRQMAQQVGKESSRDVFGEDFWMKHVDLKWRSIKAPRRPMAIGMDSGNPVYNGMILADIRYANEIEWVHERGGHVFFVVRDDAPKSSDQGHVVDQGLPLKLADLIIYNNETIDELYARVDNELAFFYSWPE
jgi:hypothetical protein